ncbi:MULTISPECIES: hypothetical protein [unclassified Pseudomonas]|uniref:hypothetical protein n=1 Tax=unclassified Pseudomonas TaxID=196821 RepID=UPI000C88D326|nr:MULTISPECIES: hypothetical protein [unclassified Pseudomonas]PMX27038.1 hypothetical protein C1Y23_10875 [Pseudomonas sp. GW460-12]PMX35259.1 hypothetical protein C1Y26_28270 [Pseudomonas sp. MPR-R2A7]PMX37082.1 hypothetical protein C1Y24_03520 [Pseudomonas sp. MPR-R2A4]PMX55269.1 hypothetical protein C1Y17_03600 [Pseudomonas sp. MPR-R2A6]PMX92777.1 hypothetical protein C1Y21_05295 [Pseudomonas sp. MPR-R2A3]
MKLATPCKTTKTQRQPVCKHCKKRFRTTSATAIYCTRQCKQLAASTKRRTTRLARATNSAFLYHLAYECERAGTLQILTGHTVESLLALHDVYKLKLKANQYGQTKDFEISHIAPVQGHAFMGLYHAENLVVAPTNLNRAHGTKHYGHGLSISRSALVSKHAVEKGAPRKQTVERIIRFLGPDVVADLVKVAKIQSTQRHALTSWLQDHLDPTVPEHRDHLDSLDGMTTQALRALKATLEGKEGGTAFVVKTTTYTASDVFLLELERHSTYRPELAVVLGILRKRVAPFTSQHLSRVSLNALEQQAVFDLLHGQPVEAIQGVLDEYIARHTSITDRGERIPAYAPIVFTFSSKQTATPVIPAAQAPARVLERLMGFAESLDDSVPDVVPVMPLVRQPVAVDPLPWEQ